MSKFIKGVCKRSRRVGLCLSLKRKGITTVSKCNRLTISPGQHGLKRKKTGYYLLQLRAKQLLKYTYNIFECQFRNYYYKALRKKGNTGFLLLLLLEMRLDNVVYRMGFASTRAEARQLVVHKHIIVSKSVNDMNSEHFVFSQLDWEVVNIPSFQVKVGYFVGIRRTKMCHQRIRDSIQESSKYEKNSHWLKVENTEMFGKFLEMPKRSDLSVNYNEHLVVELYSR